MSTETMSPSRSFRRPGMPCTISWFTETQVAAGNGSAPGARWPLKSCSPPRLVITSSTTASISAVVTSGPMPAAAGPAARRLRSGHVQDQLERRRRAVAERWNLDSEVVLIGAGEPLPMPGRADRTYPFRSHSEYLYLTHRERPGGVLAFDPEEGWVDFVAPLTKEEQLWSGGGEVQDGGVPVTELE